jgi:glycosyltransferase involved in cell wall biosynthesis
MKILYFHQHFNTPKGSGGIRSYQMARRLIERGHSVTMVCGSNVNARIALSDPFKKGRRRGFVDDIEVIEFDLPYSNVNKFLRRALTFFRFAVRSIRVALTEQYDVVFATSTPLTAGIPGIFARWLRAKTFVFEVRDLWPELPREMGVISNPLLLRLLEGLEWVSYHSASRLIALSPGMVDGIVRRGIPRDRIALVSNGCDLSIFSEGKPWRPEGIGEADFMAVYAGTHGLANGLDAVLDAAAVLKHRGRDDIRIALVGDGQLTPHLKARKEQEALDNVHFLDRMEKGRLAGLLAASDVGMQVLSNVRAFYNGTSPNKFFDYIAAGLPVLINYPGWLADLIVQNNCGVVVPPEQPEAFADALQDAGEHRDRLRQMSDNCVRLACGRFDRKVLADRWVDWVLEGQTV